jgi:hypothetical protein
MTPFDARFRIKAEFMGMTINFAPCDEWRMNQSMSIGCHMKHEQLHADEASTATH